MDTTGDNTLSNGSNGTIPSRQRRITLVTETFAPEINGVANTLGYLCQELIRRQHQVTIIRPRLTGGATQIDAREAVPGTNGRGSYREISVPGMALPGYPGLRLGLPAGRELTRLWRQTAPDAIYLATPGPLGWSARRAAANLGIATCAGFHTNFQSYSRYYGVGFLEPLISRYLRGFHNGCDATLVPTASMQARVEALGIERVSLWSRGVDCKRFNARHRCEVLRREWGLNEADLAVVYVGRLAAEKNLMQAVATYERLRGIHPRARFILVGDGPLRQRLQLRHPDYLFAGTRRDEDLARHFASGDLLLFPSKTDTFGNVVIEAMASGLAVVAFDDGAAAEHIDDLATGMKVAITNCTKSAKSTKSDHHNSDNEAYIRAALQLADQPSLRRRISRNAREKALTLSWPLLAEQFENLIFRNHTEAYTHADKQGLSTF